MKRFATFLHNIKEKSVNPVKIAIIDDGIDATDPHLPHRIVAGMSFSPYPNSTEFMNAYYVASGSHGTLLATMICDICPQPKLYIARLEERMQLNGNSRRFVPKSAANVSAPF